MASDFIKAEAASESLKQAGKVDTTLKNINNVVETTVQDMRHDLRALNDKISPVESRATPDDVINRNTRKIHRILSSYADAGQEAIANCGFAYAKPGDSTKFVSEIPEGTTWDEVCSTCLPEVRARLRV